MDNIQSVEINAQLPGQGPAQSYGWQFPGWQTIFKDGEYDPRLRTVAPGCQVDISIHNVKTHVEDAAVISPTGERTVLFVRSRVSSARAGNYVQFKRVELKDSGFWSIQADGRMFPLTIVK